MRFLSLLLIGLLGTQSAFANRIVDADLIVGQDSYKDYLKIGHFEKNVNGWSAYADAAGTVPVDCTGGSPTLAISRTTTNPLSGVGSGLLTKDAANRQGEGVSAAFTLDREVSENPRVLRVTGSYEVASGTFQYGSDSQASDIEVYLYDVTASKLVYPSANRLVGDGRISSEFQPDAASTSFRLCLHQTQTGTSSYTLKVDNLRLSTQPKVTGPIVSNWTAYTPDFANLGTVTGIEFFYRRNGDSLDIKGRATSGTTAAGVASISIPTGLVFDTTKFPAVHRIGSYARSNANAEHHAMIISTSQSTSRILFSLQTGSFADMSPRNGNEILGSESFSVDVKGIPIAGWSSNQVVSSDQGTRAVEFIALGNNQTINAATMTTLNLTTVLRDTVAGVSGNVYTFKESGTYDVCGNIGFTQAPSDATERSVFLYYRINGGAEPTAPLGGQRSNTSAAQTFDVGGCTPITVNAGNTFEFRATHTITTGSITLENNRSKFSIIKRASPQQIAASEVISATYTSSATTALSGTPTIINYETKIDDTHNAVTVGASWKFTAPASGRYSVSARFATSATAAGAVSNAYPFVIFKNGADSGLLLDDPRAVTTSAVRKTGSGTSSIVLLKGEYIDIRLSDSDATHSLFQGSVSIHRIGGVQ